MTEINNLFREYRINHKLKQQDVADYLNVPVTTYANYEQGKTETDYATLKALSRLYDVTINQLLGEEDENLIIISKNQYLKLIQKNNEIAEILKNISPKKEPIKINGDHNQININSRVKNKYKRL